MRIYSLREHSRFAVLYTKHEKVTLVIRGAIKTVRTKKPVRVSHFSSTLTSVIDVAMKRRALKIPSAKQLCTFKGTASLSEVARQLEFRKITSCPGHL